MHMVLLRAFLSNNTSSWYHFHLSTRDYHILFALTHMRQWVSSLHTQLSVNMCFGFVCFFSVWPTMKVSAASTSYSQQSTPAVWWEKSNLVSSVYFRSFGNFPEKTVIYTWVSEQLEGATEKRIVFSLKEVNLSTCSLLNVKAHVAMQESCLCT